VVQQYVTQQIKMSQMSVNWAIPHQQVPGG